MLMRNPDDALLRITDLVVEFKVRGRRDRFRAVSGVSLSVRSGTTFGLVGESGSGKTTVGRAVLGLTPVESGGISLNGSSIVDLPRKQRRVVAKDIQVVFQDPYSSLNPSLTIASTLSEPLLVQGIRGAEADAAVKRLLDQVALPSSAASRLPREFSGGQRQRIAIARALAMRPRLIICDEPVSALDLSTQARILDLFLQLQQETGVAYLFISHDLDVVRHMSHDVAVMQKGEILEVGAADDVITKPTHIYTKRLVAAAPVADPDEQARRRAIRQALRETEEAHPARTALSATVNPYSISETSAMRKQPIALQLYSVGDEIRQDMEGTIARVREMGYTTVELHRFTQDTDRLAAALRANALAAPSSHMRLLSATEEEQKVIFEAAARLGAEIVIDPKREAEYWQSLDAVQAIAEGLNAAASRAAAFGLTVGYHTHDHEIDLTFEGRAAIEHLADRLDPSISLEIDTWWGTRGEADLPAVIRALGERVQWIHVKDGRGKDANGQVAAGEGDVDIVAALEAATHSRLAVVEFDRGRLAQEPFEAIRRSRDYLVKLGLE